MSEQDRQVVAFFNEEAAKKEYFIAKVDGGKREVAYTSFTDSDSGYAGYFSREAGTKQVWTGPLSDFEFGLRHRTLTEDEARLEKARLCPPGPIGW